MFVQRDASSCLMMSASAAAMIVISPPIATYSSVSILHSAEIYFKVSALKFL